MRSCVTRAPGSHALTTLHPECIHPQIYDLQQELALLSTEPLLALSEAAELLVERMGVDFAG